MNKNLGSEIAAENVTEGMTVGVRTYYLGSAIVEILEDLKTDGWRIKVVEGYLRGRQKTWKAGDTLLLPVASVDKFYELPRGGEQC